MVRHGGDIGAGWDDGSQALSDKGLIQGDHQQISAADVNRMRCAERRGSYCRGSVESQHQGRSRTAEYEWFNRRLRHRQCGAHDPSMATDIQEYSAVHCNCPYSRDLGFSNGDCRSQE